MKGPVKRHLSEHAISFYSASCLMTSSSQLTSGGSMDSQEQEISDKSHIYIITKMPAISFSEDTFRYEDGRVSGHLTYRLTGKPREMPFNFEFPLLDDAVGVKLSPHPHRELRTYDKIGGVVRYLQANIVCMGTRTRLDFPELCELEVLYVGQSIGDGRRTATDRLKSHSTLQKILADQHYEDPDSEVFVIVFEYGDDLGDYRVITKMAYVDEPECDPDEDLERYFDILKNPLDKKQQVSLIEAGLIRYFRPRYNDIYKERFPSRTHKILQSCYKLDFSGLIVEINTEELGFKLYSEQANPDYHHICQFDLHSPNERRGFFCLSDMRGNVTRMRGVISPNA